MKTTCDICFRHCQLEDGQTGFCRTKTAENGQIRDLAYGKVSSLALDPIEKKPLARFHPGSLILSFGSYGCSLRCPFCQNWQISQQDLKDTCTPVTPETLVQKAIELKPYGNVGLAATYNECGLSPQYLKDLFQLAKETDPDLKTVLVTSGSNPVPVLEQYLPWTDAFNIDLKGFDQTFYDWVGGDLETTKAYIERAAKDAHVELTMLVIPGKNDDPDKMEAMAAWIASIDPDIPLHLSRYFPRWKCDIPPTPIETLQHLQSIAKRHLHHVYLGNV